MKSALVVGSGAGGAAAARELQGRFQVTVLEHGRRFVPFSGDIRRLGRLRRMGLFFSPRMIGDIFPAMQVRRSRERMILVNGRAMGGTTVLSTGSAVRRDERLRALGIDLGEEFSELERIIPICLDHRKLWSPASRRLFQVCSDLGLEPAALPKMGDYRRCTRCGLCVFGCRYGVKWDSRRFLADAEARGARVVSGARVERVLVEGGRAAGVSARIRGIRRTFRADLIVLAAGGLGTPAILAKSGWPCRDGLFVDPVLCVAAERPDSGQDREPAMPFSVRREGYMLSPYLDWLSFFFHPDWRRDASGIISLMIKLGDEGSGSAAAGKVRKGLTAADRLRLDEARSLCLRILAELGIDPRRTFTGLLNAGHPGGLLPLTREEAGDLHPSSLPGNLYVMDATRLPAALGAPNILTVAALALRAARICIRNRSHF